MLAFTRIKSGWLAFRRTLIISGLALPLAVSAVAQDANTGASTPQGDNDRHPAPLVNLTATGGDITTAGASVTVTGEAATIKAAGANVLVRANASGDVQLAGAVVEYVGSVGGDLWAAGASNNVRGAVAGSLHAAGAAVWIGATVGKDLNAAGANVTIGITSDVGGNLKAGAANLTISGHVAGDATLGGALVTINGRIDGAVDARAAQVIVNPGAVIGGDLTVYSLNDPIIAEGATVAGTVHRFAPPTWWSETSWAWLGGLAAAIAAGTVLTGIVLMLFGGGIFATATGHVRHRPLSSFLFGVLAFVLIPFIAFVLMATVIGLSVGFAVLFIMPVLVIFGHAIAAAGIAAGILLRRPGDLGVGMGLLMLIIGAIVLVGIGLIPFVGPLLVLIALVLGVGALARTIGGRVRRAEPTPPISAARIATIG